jgi:hypothetical protein
VRFAAVIFDLDGTLLDSMDDLADSLNVVLAARGMPVTRPRAFRRFVGDGIVKHGAPGRASGWPRGISGASWRISPPSTAGAGMPRAGPIRAFPGCSTPWPRPGCGWPCSPTSPTTSPDASPGASMRPGPWTRRGEPGRAFPSSPIRPRPWDLARELGLSRRRSSLPGDRTVDVRTGKRAGMFAAGVLGASRTRPNSPPPARTGSSPRPGIWPAHSRRNHPGVTHARALSILLHRLLTWPTGCPLRHPRGGGRRGGNGHSALVPLSGRSGPGRGGARQYHGYAFVSAQGPVAGPATGRARRRLHPGPAELARAVHDAAASSRCRRRTAAPWPTTRSRARIPSARRIGLPDGPYPCRRPRRGGPAPGGPGLRPGRGRVRGGGVRRLPAPMRPTGI